MAIATIFMQIKAGGQNAKIRAALFNIGNYCRGSDLKHDKVKYQQYVKG
jgi:hypothetical protein